MDHASISQDREDLARYRALYGSLPNNKKEHTVIMSKEISKKVVKDWLTEVNARLYVQGLQLTSERKK
jgi:hypothetical protein